MNKSIGERLVISRRSVQRNVNTIFDKLDIRATEDDDRRILAVIAYGTPRSTATSSACDERTTRDADPVCADRARREGSGGS